MAIANKYTSACGTFISKIDDMILGDFFKEFQAIVEHSDINSVIEILSELNRRINIISLRPFIIKTVHEIIKIRDKGCLFEAVCALLKLNHIFPENKSVIVELLVIATHSYPNRSLYDLMVLKTPQSLLDDNVIRTIISFGAIKNHDFETASKIIEVSYESITQEIIFTNMWSTVVKELLLKDEKFASGVNIEVLQNLIRSINNPNDLYDFLYSISTCANFKWRFEFIAGIISTISFEKSEECFAVAYFFLRSLMMKNEASLLEENNQAFSENSRHPLYVKAKLGQSRVDTVVKFDPKIIIDKYLTHDHVVCSKSLLWRDACLHDAELRNRSHNYNINQIDSSISDNKAEINILFALFGQTRFPEYTLNEIKNWVEENFLDYRKNVSVHYAISTWEKTGSRPVSLSDHIGFIIPHLPSKISNIVSGMNLFNVADLNNIFPYTVSKIISKQNNADKLDVNYIKNTFGTDVFLDIASDAAFMSDFGSHLISEFGEVVPILNQGRMINRISAVGQLLEQIENAKNINISHVMLMRPDLVDLKGSIQDVLEQMLNHYNWAVTDEDVYANLIDGIGDRYIFLDRRAADTLFKIENEAKSMLSSENKYKDLYRNRIGPHQMLKKILFEGNVDIRSVPRSQINWNIFRGQMNKSDIYDSVRLDMNNISDKNLIKILNEAIE